MAAEKQARAPRVEITITLGNDQESRDTFIGGCEEGDFNITRGKPVTVPRSVLERLDNAVIGVPTQDPTDPTGTRVIFEDRKRFPYTIHREIA